MSGPFYGLVGQIIIGVTALLVTINIRDIPANSIRLQNYFLGMGITSFGLGMV